MLKINEQIKSAISNLHDQDKSDYETLLRQVDNHYEKVILNLPQMMASLSKSKMLILEWGRGTG